MAVKKPKIPKPTKPTTTPAQDSEAHKELMLELVERGKRNGFLTYEAVLEFGEEHNLTEKESDDLQQLLEKEHIDLVSLEDLDEEHTALEDFESADTTKTALQTLELSDEDYDEEEIEEREEEEKEERLAERVVSSGGQIADSVKSYLRDIGKIPLLNKETETAIAD